MASSLQLTIQTIQDIHLLEPANFHYKVTSINTKLTHLFMLALLVSHQLSKQEKLQHTLTIYSKICQPEVWAQWVRAHVDDFDLGSLHQCQTQINQAQRK